MGGVTAIDDVGIVPGEADFRHLPGKVMDQPEQLQQWDGAAALALKKRVFSMRSLSNKIRLAIKEIATCSESSYLNAHIPINS